MNPIPKMDNIAQYERYISKDLFADVKETKGNINKLSKILDNLGHKISTTFRQIEKFVQGKVDKEGNVKHKWYNDTTAFNKIDKKFKQLERALVDKKTIEVIAGHADEQTPEAKQIEQGIKDMRSVCNKLKASAGSNKNIENFEAKLTRLETTLHAAFNKIVKQAERDNLNADRIAEERVTKRIREGDISEGIIKKVRDSGFEEKLFGKKSEEYKNPEGGRKNPIKDFVREEIPTKTKEKVVAEDKKEVVVEDKKAEEKKILLSLDKALNELVDEAKKEGLVYALGGAVVAELSRENIALDGLIKEKPKTMKEGRVRGNQVLRLIEKALINQGIFRKDDGPVNYNISGLSKDYPAIATAYKNALGIVREQDAKAKPFEEAEAKETARQDKETKQLRTIDKNRQAVVKKEVQVARDEGVADKRIRSEKEKGDGVNIEEGVIGKNLQFKKAKGRVDVTPEMIEEENAAQKIFGEEVKKPREEQKRFRNEVISGLKGIIDEAYADKEFGQAMIDPRYLTKGRETPALDKIRTSLENQSKPLSRKEMDALARKVVDLITEGYEDSMPEDMGKKFNDLDKIMTQIK